MRIQKQKVRLLGIILAVMMSFFAIQQGSSVPDATAFVNATSTDQLAVHTLERQQGSFLDILGSTESTLFAQARITRNISATRLQNLRNVLLWAGLNSGFTASATHIYLASCRIENIFVRSHAWIMAYIHRQDGEKAFDSLK